MTGGRTTGAAAGDPSDDEVVTTGSGALTPVGLDRESARAALPA